MLTYTDLKTKKMLALFPQYQQEILIICTHNDMMQMEDYALNYELAKLFDGVNSEDYNITYTNKGKLTKVLKKYDRGIGLDSFFKQFDESYTVKRLIEDGHNADSIIYDLADNYNLVKKSIELVKNLKNPCVTIPVINLDKSKAIEIKKKAKTIKVHNLDTPRKIDVDVVILSLPRVFEPFLALFDNRKKTRKI